MEKLKIEDLKEGLNIGYFGDCFCNYNCGYISDIVSEIADNNIDVYYANLFAWATNNTTYIEEALQEFGEPRRKDNTIDFIKIIQGGQYYAYERELYDNLEDNLKFFMYDYIEKILKLDEITEEQNKQLLNWDFADNNEKLEHLIKHIKEAIKILE